MGVKTNDVIKFNLDGEVVKGRVVKTWAKMKDKLGIEVQGFNYTPTNFRHHIIDRSRVIN